MTVVNCFRSLYLWVDLQRLIDRLFISTCCELLSFFVPLGWFTAVDVTGHQVEVLWIAFVLCTFGLIYSRNINNIVSSIVVNCFRSLYLWVDLQLFASLAAGRRVVNCFRSLYLWVDLQQCEDRKGTGYGCELLSFFVPLGWFTATNINIRQCV